MAQKHPYFAEHQFDKAYRAVTRSFKLKPNEKTLISHIITWQETTDENTGKLLGLMCFESNSTLSRELGIPLSTLESLINKMKKKYDFFTSTSIPGKGISRRGGNFNRTIKRIDMNKLKAFLEAEQAILKANQDLDDEEGSSDPGVEAEVLQVAHNVLQSHPEQQEEPVEGSLIQLESMGNGEVNLQDQASTAPEPYTPLKNRTTKEHAFDQLSDLLRQLDAAFDKNVKQVQTNLQVVLMNHPSWTQVEKVVYNEWVSDFMTEEYPLIKEYYLKQKDENNCTQFPGLSLDEVYLP